MKHIKLYSSEDAFVAEKEILSKPYVTLTKDDKEVHYSFEPFYGLTFTALEDNSSVGMEMQGTVDKVLQYKVNDGEWAEWNKSPITLNTDDKMYLKSDDNKGLGVSTTDYLYFTMDGKISASGNIMSLLDYADELPEYAFIYLFKNCSALTTAPELPSMNLSSYCYAFLFHGCDTLITAPKLPAIEMASRCYYYMFQNCTSLVNAPKLPATKLDNYCYYYMFNNCTSLVNAPELPATEMADGCYWAMFFDCTSLVNVPKLPAMEMKTQCYRQMFYNCKSIETSPELPATVVANQCYYAMFKGCANLKYGPSILPAMELASECYNVMFQTDAMLIKAPVLPAQTLVNKCYSNMFNGCKQLNYVKALFLTEPTTAFTQNWLSGTSSTGTFVKSIDAEWNVRSVTGIPTGWTVETA